MDEEIDFAYIDQVSASLRNLLYVEDNYAWFNRMIEYYETNQEFPEDISVDVNNLLAIEISKNPDMNYVREDYKYVVNNYPDGVDQLLYQLFYHETEEVIIEDNGGEECQFDSTDDESEEDYVKIVLTMNDILQKQYETISEIANTLNLHDEAAEVLLKEYNFKEDQIYSQYSGNGEIILSKIGLTHNQASNPIHLQKSTNSDCCGVCFIDGVDLYALPCGHCFCKECWVEYIKTKINNGAFIIRCQEERCKCQITMNDVVQFCGEKIANTYTDFILENNIHSDGNLMHCLRPGCPNVLTSDCVGLCQVATCTCGMRLCWKCKEAAHAPLSCNLLEQWRKITDDEVLEAKWIKENTKPCPKCHERIEKNGGCNHMTCRIDSGGCGFEFCWICGHEWKSHVGDGYNCNKFTDFDSLTENKGTPAFDLKRLSHYHTRFLSHKTSSETEEKNEEKNKMSIINYFENYPKTNEKLPIEEAICLADEIFLTTKTARSVLIWSYPHAFYLDPSDPELKIFQHVQTEVERYLEAMTDLIENNRTRSPSEFRKAMKILACNTEVLNKHVDQYSL
ncbi:IBR domain containing protein [Tritrichomonas foetus]|uniref:RBR-type E3 ubiquitin transferase n=1 Tax=Tritrichomonas foetus TaxID=1144522 RepID=A0A1J4L5M6_9EUKA|nr:IBR domain containing protein [Tritrichomonas foetus]|eukprot:OHT17253.1 IBR domain containing protein [Tritrichomonas foetus]